MSRLSPEGGAPRGIFYGWYVIGAMFFMSLVAVAPRQGLGLFFGTWTEEFGVSVAALSAVVAAGWLVNGVSQPIFGGLADRYGGRIVMSLSMLILGIGTVLLGAIGGIWTFALVYVPLVSFAMGGVLFVPATTVVVRWFRRKRGTAMGLLTSGASVGGILLVPFMAYLLVIADWRVTWMVVGGMMIFLGAPLVWTVLRNSPQEMGLLPDGETPSLGETAPGEAAPGGPSTAMRQGPLAVDRWRTAYRSAPIWQLTFSYVVCGITTSGMAVHFVPYAVDKGISTSTAALAFGLLNLINLAGVIGVGFWSDRLLRKNVLAVIYAVRGLAFLLLVFLPSGVGLWAFAIVGGASWLATVSQTSALTAEIYGVKRAGTLTGMLTMIHQFGGAAAVFAAGAIFTWLGTYTPFFLFAAGALVFASVMSWTVRERSSSVRFVVDGDVSGGLAAERA